jgi:hypothetical protein
MDLAPRISQREVILSSQQVVEKDAESGGDPKLIDVPLPLE